MSEVLSLESLFAEAKPALRAMKNAKPAAPVKADPSLLYTNPDNWYRSRSIALIQETTREYLGTFDELLHRSVKNCRRLVRTTDAVKATDVEYTTCSFSTYQPAVDRPQTQAISLRFCLCLSLPPSRATALIHVYRQGPAIAKVELVEDAEFALDDGVLVLPAETSIFPFLTRECKIALNQETSHDAQD